MASARHSMGPSRVSSTLFDHKEQSAATKLQVVDHSGLEPSGKLLSISIEEPLLDFRNSFLFS